MFSVVLTDQKELNVKRTPIVLKSFIDKLLLELERELKSKKVVFKTNILEDLVCYEDYNMLVIIFNNIMMNAIQHTQKGRINVEAHEVNDKVVLIVEDTGKGIAKDRVDQLNAGTYQPKEGKAFGLKISKMLLDEMDAYLQIESEERVGTTVSVFLSKNIENIGM
jgi:signal transduction histidine kinase